MSDARPTARDLSSQGRSDDRPLAIVDLDGVVADVRHRLEFLERRPKDWDGFFGAAIDDPVHDDGRATVERLRQDHEVIYLTGRPRRTERDTRSWLDRNGLGGHRLEMRSGRDFRPSSTVKVETLGRLAEGRTVGIVVDDDERVIAAMAAAGYPTFHATWERRAIDADAELRRAQESDGRT